MIEIKNNYLVAALLAIVTAIQLTICLAQILSHFTPVSPMTVSVVAEWQSLLRPEWEMVVYRFFIVSAIMGMIFWIKYLDRVPHIMKYLINEAFLTALMLGTYFKIVVYANQPMMATYALLFFIGMAVAHKFFWVLISRKLDDFKSFLFDKRNEIYLSRLLVFFTPILIFLIIDVPSIQGAVARFFVGEQFHHNDSFIYGPGWAYVSGARLDWDVISQYGVGAGVIFGSIGQMIGGFNYETGLQIMIWGAIIYYTLWFFLMRTWLQSTLIAATGVLLALKFQLFNAGVYPFAFTYGSATVIRVWFDVFVMVAILGHIKRPSVIWLFMAAVCSGVQLFYIPSDGVYLYVMLASYILGWIVLNGGMKKLGYLGILLIPFITMLILMTLFIGPVVWQKMFWQNMQEFVAYFLNGFGLTPIYSNLQDRQFLASAMGFVLPAVYVLMLVGVGALLFLKKIDKSNIFACVISIYGLCLYHYYVARSGPSSYYVVSLPFVMLLMYGLSKLRSKNLNLGAFVVAVLFLIFNQNFIGYPNRLNLSQNPLTDVQVAQPLSNGSAYFHHLYRDYNEQLKVPVNTLGDANEMLFAESDVPSDDALLLYYKQASDFSMDAAMINRLLKPQEPAALISSFEIKILMDAKRRPYFYYFPLAISHPLRSRTLVRSSIYTTDQLNKVFQRLDQDKPEYIFVERILLTRPLSETFYYYYSSMVYLTDFVLQRYEVVEQGQYLVAMQLKK